MEALPGGVHTERVLGGRYQTLRLIAKGGMAEVWEAVDDVLGRRVAVKVLHPHLAADASFHERFRREAIAAARLAHPNIVSTFDTGTDGGVTFIVMELVDGTTLRQVLNQTGPLPPGRAVHVAAAVADALAYAHKAGIVHRDVKPANILICPDGRVKVADFGIAKAVEDAEPSRPEPAEALTGIGSIIGTAQYLSPEQVDDRPVDGRTDVYALGVVLYEMLCGRVPFTGTTDMAVALQHVTATPLAPRQVRGGIPRDLEAVVLRAMAKAPDARYQSAGDMQTALLSVDLGVEDATNVVVAPTGYRPPAVADAATPPRGIPPSFVQSERRWLVPTIGIVAVALTLGIVGVLFARSDTGQSLLGNSTKATNLPASGQQAIPTPTPLAFDPSGDGVEHNSDLGNLVDEDPSTTWSTEQYSTNKFGGLKPGVGVVLRLDATHKLKQLTVTSPSTGWSADVLVQDSPKPTRDAWGDPVASKQGIPGGTTTFDLGGKSGGAVLLWITDLGDGTSVTLADLKLSG